MVEKMRGLGKKKGQDKQQTEEETTQNLNNHPERHMVINDAVNGGVLESRAKNRNRLWSRDDKCVGVCEARKRRPQMKADGTFKDLNVCLRWKRPSIADLLPLGERESFINLDLP